jgi:hypothetical protein
MFLNKIQEKNLKFQAERVSKTTDRVAVVIRGQNHAEISFHKRKYSTKHCILRIWNICSRAFVEGTASLARQVNFLPSYTDNCTENNRSWETNDFAANKENLHILWNCNTGYHVHNRPQLVCIMIHENLVHVIIFHISESNSYIMLPSIIRSHKLSLSLRLYGINLYGYLPMIHRAMPAGA